MKHRRNNNLGAVWLIAGLALAPLAHGEIYKWVDENGRTHFSDQRPQNQAVESLDIDTGAPASAPTTTATTATAFAPATAGVLGELADGDNGETELYVLTVGGDAKQDVFMMEALYVKQLFDRRYATRGRSASLINNARTAGRYPMASLQTLEATLQRFAAAMGEEDVLYLYFTAHGSRDHQLSIDFPPRELADINGRQIRQLLDKAGIKWRVVVVSACFSGGFVPPLANAHTVVATAADATHTSFGCSDDRDFTFYGEAVYKRLMANGAGILEALDRARDVVKTMEKELGYTHSNPQLQIGAQARTKLDQLPRL